VDATLAAQAQRRPGYTARFAALMSDPDALAAYVAQRCNSYSVSSSSDVWQNYARFAMPVGTDAPAGQDVAVCLNLGYLDAQYECASALALHVSHEGCACLGLLFIVVDENLACAGDAQSVARVRATAGMYAQYDVACMHATRELVLLRLLQRKRPQLTGGTV
jgi:hypothetical protein